LAQVALAAKAQVEVAAAVAVQVVLCMTQPLIYQQEL
jgi:hypothetical protein